MDPSDETYLGRAAYEGYLNSSRGVSLVSGQPLPNWEEQDDKIRKAWVAAAQAVQKALPAPELTAAEDPAELTFAPDAEG